LESKHRLSGRRIARPNGFFHIDVAGLGVEGVGQGTKLPLGFWVFATFIYFLQPSVYVPIWFTENHMNEPPNKLVRTDGAEDPLISFTPEPVRKRHDGWTVDKQYAFIQALAETGIVEEACRRVGMSRTSADKLRSRPCGVHFRRAWEIAIDYSLNRIEEEAFLRSRRGVARPIFYKGEQVGEWRHYDERLTMFLLRSRRPQRYGKWIERMLAPEPEEGDQDGYQDPAIALDGGLENIEWDAGDVPLVDENEPNDGGSEQP
jgi:hypothetical protein